MIKVNYKGFNSIIFKYFKNKTEANSSVSNTKYTLVSIEEGI